MFSSKLRIGVVVCGFLTLALATGCSKKNKPDQDAVNPNNVLGASNVQDKDMNLNATGSDTAKIEGLYTVHFDYDKSSITPESRDLLVKDAKWLKGHKNKDLQIEGHCDRHGSLEYNMALGQRRATAVKKYLENLGVKANRLSTISYGKEKLLDVAETDEADAKNRRANFLPVDAPSTHMSQR
jgi:peptidoglycan-associated lipoprotein